MVPSQVAQVVGSVGTVVVEELQRNLLAAVGQVDPEEEALESHSRVVEVGTFQEPGALDLYRMMK